MLKRASVLLGLAILLSLLLPVNTVLVESGVDPRAVRLPGLDLAGLCALLALLPSFALFHDARLGQRLARWNLWLALLALSSIVFLLLHVSWSAQLATAYVQEALAPGGTLPLPVSHRLVLEGAELAARLGVLVCLVGVLVNLQAVPQEEAPRQRGRRK